MYILLAVLVGAFLGTLAGLAVGKTIRMGQREQVQKRNKTKTKKEK